MPKVRLTDLALQSLSAPETGHRDYWDATVRTFGIRVSPAGTKTFIVKIDNSRRSLGRYPEIKLVEARDAARRLLAERTLGKVRPTAITFSKAKDDFIEEKENACKPSTADEYKRLLDRLPFKGNIADITHDEFRRQLKKFTAQSERDHILVAARVFFNWCAKQPRRYIADNPAGGIEKKKAKSRDRVLTDDELRAIWTACCLPDTEMPEDFTKIVRLLLVTGQRRGEIAALHRRFYSHNEQTITLPAELTKNSREHLFPLGELGRGLLPMDRQGLYFPARGKSTPFNGWSKSKRELDKLCGVQSWRLHDLRRTFRTNLSRLGVMPHISERLLNHVSSRSELEDVYDKFQYLPEKRDAIERWEGHLTNILFPKQLAA